MNFPSIKKKKYLLFTIIFFNIFCLVSSLSQKDSIKKLNLTPWSFLWEFFVINWCAWNSLINLIYSVNELKINSERKIFQLKKQKDFSFVVSVSNLVSMSVFSVVYFLDSSVANGKSWFFLIRSIIWHYLVPLMSLFYFFKIVKLKKTDLDKKNLPYIVFPMPIFFCFANLTRRFLLSDSHFEKKNLKKFIIPYFELIEKGELIHFFFFIIFSLLAFWLFSIFLLKVKEKFFPSTIISTNNKKNFLLRSINEK